MVQPVSKTGWNRPAPPSKPATLIHAVMDENKPRPRWLSFGIRDLLWAMVVLSLMIGWWNQSRLNWLGTHPRWREVHESGLIEREPRFVGIEYRDGGTGDIALAPHN